MKTIKKMLAIIYIVAYQQNYITAAQETTKATTKTPATMVQHQANVKNDTHILEKLALIDKQDKDDNKAIQERSYNSLFNNAINFKNFLLHTFTKKQIEELCHELINQIYPEESFNAIDFGEPIIQKIEKKEIMTPKTEEVAQTKEESTVKNEALESKEKIEEKTDADKKTDADNQTQVTTEETTKPEESTAKKPEDTSSEKNTTDVKADETTTEPTTTTDETSTPAKTA